jgi:hypothetical protein
MRHVLYLLRRPFTAPRPTRAIEMIVTGRRDVSVYQSLEKWREIENLSRRDGHHD